MAKEKKVCLEPADYWKWRTAISEMDLTTAKFELAATTLNAIGKDVEIAQLKHRIYQIKNVPESRSAATVAKDEYKDLTKELEEKYGISMVDKVVSDDTFEVRPLDKNSNDVKLDKGEK
jgi:hypothetical protein